MAPDREVRAAVVQLQGQVADRVGEVETDDGTGGMAEPRDLLEVEGLAGAVLHAGPQYQREALAVLVDRAFDRLHRERAVGLVGFDFDQGVLRRQATVFQLRFHRVAIRREAAGLDQDRGALDGRLVEADQHQVQVGGQRIHRHHFGRLRADHPRQRVAHQLVVGHPLRAAGEVAFDGFGRPLVQYFLDMRARALRLQTQRIADEIGLRLAVVLRDEEFVAKTAQRIGGIARLRERVGNDFGHANLEAGRPSHSSAVPW